MSFLFIPAFMFGVASVFGVMLALLWGLVFAIALGWFFRKRLLEIIEGYNPIEDDSARARYARRRLIRLVVECAAIMAAPLVFVSIINDRLGIDFRLSSGHGGSLLPHEQVFVMSFPLSITVFFTVYLLSLKPFSHVLHSCFSKQPIKYRRGLSQKEELACVAQWNLGRIYSIWLIIFSFVVFGIAFMFAGNTINNWEQIPDIGLELTLLLTCLWPFISAIFFKLGWIVLLDRTP
jgi:hypothetical protein